ncbi:MAG: hypothetical protein DI539_09355 [Flavobacterium psychrophilum]|nr:MAG: hypothetical protein DI539_09355 [Flavobacterium psychrophilum]
MKRFFTLMIVMLFASTAYCQLSDFTFSVVKTNETCLGNGSLTFTVNNTTPNSSILYKVFILPDDVNPFTVTTSNYLGSLSAATYKIEAIQSLGNSSNRKEITITIDNDVIPFAFEVTTSSHHCEEVGNIIVNATSGVGASYEIIYGPEMRPLQASNVFEGLAPGTYNIRAFDNCGVGKVKTYTLEVVSAGLNISATSYPETISTVCDSIKVMNTINATSGTLGYPLTVESTLSPLDIGGNPIVINQTFATGDPYALDVVMTVPRYQTESYTYDMKVTDVCHIVYEKTDNVVDPNISVTLSPGKVPCAEKYIKLDASRYTTSYTVKFVNAPAEFVASEYNTTPNGPFTQQSINYGSETHSVPFGDYVVEITDICGRKAIDTLKIEFIKPVPTQYGVNNGCFALFGYIRASVPESKLVSAIITAAPALYTATLPQDVSASITLDGILALNDLPLGFYTITITDDCGFEYEIIVEVPPYKERDFGNAMLPSCTVGLGTLTAYSGNGVLTAASVINAPAGFNHPMPYNVTSKIGPDGRLYMDALPPGTYTIKATDVCGIVKDQDIIVEGYVAPVDPFTFTPNCGTFMVALNDASNGKAGSAYWLQLYDPATATWKHPLTGLTYVEGSVPDDSTGLLLANNVTRNNLNFNGKMRIVKKFECYGDGTNEMTKCVSILGEFTYTEQLEITAAYTLACAGQPNDVILQIMGYPVTYKIRAKNGQPFYVDNGPNNVFTNLEPAEYLFQIEDACGNIDIKGYNMQSLPSLTDATQPSDMIFCAEPGGEDTFEFHLTEQNAQILGSYFPSMYTLTYHISQEDADSGSNALPEYYNNISNGQTIYARLIHNEIAICYGTTSFKLFVGEKPVPELKTAGTICNEGVVTITAQAGFKSYLWSTGQTTRTIVVSEPGIYTVTVEKAYGNDRSCFGENKVEIKTSVTPTIVKIDTSDWTRNQNTITVHAEGSGYYEYSLDGANYQTENTFSGLETGVYQVFVRDALGCGEDIQELVLLNYPNFFTPNGDGHNDRWRIEYSIKEPNLTVDIFDRYGKHITTLTPTS